MNTGWRGQTARRTSYPGQDPNHYTRRHRRFMTLDTRAQAAGTLATPPDTRGHAAGGPPGTAAFPVTALAGALRDTAAGFSGRGRPAVGIAGRQQIRVAVVLAEARSWLSDKRVHRRREGARCRRGRRCTCSNCARPSDHRAALRLTTWRHSASEDPMELQRTRCQLIAFAAGLDSRRGAELDRRWEDLASCAGAFIAADIGVLCGHCWARR